MEMTVNSEPCPAIFSQTDFDVRCMLETLVNNLDGMLLRCRIDEHWTILFVSCGCQPLTGYPPADLIGSQGVTYEAITHEEDRGLVRKQLMAAIRDNRPYRVEYRIRRADNDIRWVSERGKKIVAENGEVVLEAFIEDVTEQVEARTRLALAEARYRSLFEHSSEGIFQSTADGRYLSANPALAAIYGYDSPNELMSTLNDIGNQLYVKPGQRRLFQQMMAERGCIQDFESEIMRSDGSRIWIAENAR